MLRYLDDPKLLDEYMKLKAERDEINERLDEIRPQIAAAVDDEGGTFAYKDHEFTTSVRTTYDYAHIDKIQDLKDELKHFEAIAKKNASKLGAPPEMTADIKKQSIVLTMKYKPQGVASR